MPCCAIFTAMVTIVWAGMLMMNLNRAMRRLRCSCPVRKSILRPICSRVSSCGGLSGLGTLRIRIRQDCYYVKKQQEHRSECGQAEVIFCHQMHAFGNRLLNDRHG